MSLQYRLQTSSRGIELTIGPGDDTPVAEFQRIRIIAAGFRSKAVSTQATFLVFGAPSCAVASQSAYSTSVIASLPEESQLMRMLQGLISTFSSPRKRCWASLISLVAGLHRHGAPVGLSKHFCQTKKRIGHPVPGPVSTSCAKKIGGPSSHDSLVRREQVTTEHMRPNIRPSSSRLERNRLAQVASHHSWK